MAEGKILVVEDEDNQKRLIAMHLTNEGFDVATADDSEDAIRILENTPIDLVLADLHLPGKSGLELLKQARSDHPQTVVILMTAYGTIQSAVDALKAGAYDYLTKPIHYYELTQLVHRAIEHRALANEVGLLRTCLDKKYGFEKIVGSSEPLMHVLDIAARAAASDATILIRGETGKSDPLSEPAPRLPFLDHQLRGHSPRVA
jgi:DNA-binding NtrC family response regulator